MKIKNLIFKVGLPAVLLVCFLLGMYGLAFANGVLDSSENVGEDFSQVDVENVSLESESAFVNPNAVSYITIADANNTTIVNFKLDSQASSTYPFTKVKVEYFMYYKDIVTRYNSVNVDSTSISGAGEFSVDFNDYGKFVCIVYLINASEQVVWSETDEDVRVTADVYNIAIINGSLPVCLFSLQMWGENSPRHDGPVVVDLQRVDTYDWSKLPKERIDSQRKL